LGNVRRVRTKLVTAFFAVSRNRSQWAHTTLDAFFVEEQKVEKPRQCGTKRKTEKQSEGVKGERTSSESTDFPDQIVWWFL